MYSHEEDIDSAIDVFSRAIQYYQAQQVLWLILLLLHLCILADAFIQSDFQERALSI